MAKLNKDNLLIKVNPELAKEWHPSKNGDLTPYNVTKGSTKKVWWQCEKGHQWQAAINNRYYNNSKCPYCSGKKVSIENNLMTLRPVVAKEWHHVKNGSLKPSDVLCGSNKKVWWQCEKGHEWEASINERCNSRRVGTKCPFCDGKKVSIDNCLATKNPKLAEEWHPTKNGELTPYDFTYSSNKKVWWECNRGHEWIASINNRNAGKACPKCKEYWQTSFPELAIYYYLKKVFKTIDRRYLMDIDGVVIELDIYIDELKLAVEYDGYYYHKDDKLYERDELKNELLQNKIKIIRIREKGLPDIQPYDCIIYKRKNNQKEKCLVECINYIIGYVNSNFTLIKHKQTKLNEMIIDIERDRYEIYNLIETHEHNNSLSIKYPDIAKEWHTDKNGKLTPESVSWGSYIKVWWQCEKGHQWQAKVKSRTSSGGKATNCPYCSGSKVCIDNCLSTKNPKLAEEWHPFKNGSLTPYDVTRSSGKKVWWKCKKGHEWNSIIASRNKNVGCPYCSGNRVTKENCLQELRPDISREWHPTKNSKVTPSEVTLFSSKKVWWKCSEGHEWTTTVSGRTRNDGKATNCPYCSGRKVCTDNCLATVNSELAQEWHPSKNNGLTPYDVTLNSNKKVWWKCKDGHEWQATVNHRNYSSRCRKCWIESKKKK